MHLKETTSNSVETQKLELKVYSRRPKQVKTIGSSKKAKTVEFKIANNSEPNHTWGSNATDVPSFSSLVNDRNCLIRKRPNCKDYGLAKDGLARGIPKLKFKKDHLCSTCALVKSKKSSHQPKAEDTNQEKLYLSHMDLCGPMRVESINRKKYILVIVDDYSRFTWVKFLRSKDEAPGAIIKCIKNIQVRLNVTVWNVRIDNGTEFVNQTFLEFYENVSISRQTSVARTPQQNGVVERRNRTLVKAARTIEDLGKLNAKADISIFVGYAPAKKAFRIYNRRNRKIMETIHVTFDELTAMAFEQFSSGHGLQSMTPATSVLGLVPKPFPVAVAPRTVDIVGLPSSTAIDQDAPSSSTSSTNQQEKSLIISQGVKEPIPKALFDDPCHEPFRCSNSKNSSSNVQSSHSLLELIGKWTKDHPLTNVIGNSSRLVCTRKQLEIDAMWCYFDAFLTSVELKNFKQAILEPSWIDAMQEEIREF
ncbi:retrovirus-related pol polyprotein from transposon TNT 1-94 [Tanacetum coccineum]